MGVHVVTGGAGFVAVNLIEKLLDHGEKVLAIDNLSRGRSEHWTRFSGHSHFSPALADCADLGAFRAALDAGLGREDATDVWHLAANSDIPAGIADPLIDLNNTFRTTFNTLLLMRERAIPNLHFASSSAIYGDLGEIAIHENIGPLQPISNYGAMKLASEAQIRAVVEASTMCANVFRFPNVVGVPATHGVILDFVRKLAVTKETLHVLGDGSQTKSYLHVEELIDAMLFISGQSPGRYNVFNIGPADEGACVSDIAKMVRNCLAPHASISYGEGNRGWIGDVPRFRYSIDRLAALGWRPKLSSLEALQKAVTQIAEQEAGQEAD